MLFIIESAKKPNARPCRNAVKLKNVTYVDVRYVGDPSEVIHCGQDDSWWFGEGKNHRKENGLIKRDFEKSNNSIWVLELSSLEGLTELAEEINHSLLLNLNTKDSHYLESNNYITIKDSYL